MSHYIERFLDGTLTGPGVSGTFYTTITHNDNGTFSGTWNFTWGDPSIDFVNGTLSGSGSTATFRGFFGDTFGTGTINNTGTSISIINASYYDLYGYPHTVSGTVGAPLPPVISIDQYSGRIEEIGTVRVTLKRSGSDLSQSSSVVLSTEDGAASSSGVAPDFRSFTDTVTFGPNETTVIVNFPADTIIDDTREEPNENFGIRLSSPTNATLGFSTGNITILDNDYDQTINGNVGANALVGGGGNDTISGYAGNDVLNGQTGNDMINGGAGNDTLNGGTGGDTLNGDGGNDRLNGDEGNDRLNGGDGNDTLSGGAGNDTLNGGGSADTLNGGGGNDTLVWHAADTLLDGGTGTDTLRVNGAGVTLDLRAVENTKILNVEVINITGTGNNHLKLSAQDVLDLSTSTDTLRIDGNAGDVVHRGTGWTRGAGVTIGSNDYFSYTKNGATLLVDTDISSSVT